MSRARDLADLMSGTGILADGSLATTEIAGVTVSNTEVNHLSGLTTNVQTALNSMPTTGRVISLATALG